MSNVVGKLAGVDCVLTAGAGTLEMGANGSGSTKQRYAARFGLAGRSSDPRQIGGVCRIIWTANAEVTAEYKPA